ncbi:MAG: pyridoxal-phosphate dependent enzyme, partial [Halobacteria archaeon]|nr:pyridoxal-phosphate dependent enzyme [Halobacteria archaeon]
MEIELECRSCGNIYSTGKDEPWRCECGHPLDYSSTPVPDHERPSFKDLETRKGLWAFDDFLPVEPRVTLREGFTPLVEDEVWNATFKLEYVFPSGSFKDRGSTTTVSKALEIGAEKIVEDSSGNAGASIAQYAARAGIPAEIYVPEGVKKSKLDAIKSVGAKPVVVEGDRDQVTQKCTDEVESGDAWYASHAWNPVFFEGTKTFALELMAQRDWEAPEAVVLPVGHGTLLLGAYRGFRSLIEAGWMSSEDIPRLLGAQAAGYAPVVEELNGGQESDDKAVSADGIHINKPVRGSQIVDAIHDTEGDATAVSETQLRGALDKLHGRGFYVEPTSGVG